MGKTPPVFFIYPQYSKVLINRDGEIVERFEPTADVKKIAEKVKEVL